MTLVRMFWTCFGLHVPANRSRATSRLGGRTPSRVSFSASRFCVQRRQRGQYALHGGAQLGLHQRPLGLGVAGQLGHISLFAAPNRPLSSGSAGVRGERERPRDRIAAGVVVAAVGEQVHERLLSGVLGGRPVEEPPAEAENKRMKPRKRGLQRRAIPVRDAGEVRTERRSFIGLHAPLRAERAARTTPGRDRACHGGGEREAGNGQPEGDEGEDTFVHGISVQGSWACAFYGRGGDVGVTGQAFFVSAAGPQPQEPVLAQLEPAAAVWRVRHH